MIELLEIKNIKDKEKIKNIEDIIKFLFENNKVCIDIFNTDKQSTEKILNVIFNGVKYLYNNIPELNLSKDLKKKIEISPSLDYVFDTFNECRLMLRTTSPLSEENPILLFEVTSGNIYVNDYKIDDAKKYIKFFELYCKNL